MLQESKEYKLNLTKVNDSDKNDKIKILGRAKRERAFQLCLLPLNVPRSHLFFKKIASSTSMYKGDITFGVYS